MSNEREATERTMQLNLVVGVATNMMVALGMPWRVEVGNLCNFGDDFETINLRWKMAEKEACKRIVALLPPIDDGDLPVCECCGQRIINKPSEGGTSPRL